MLFNDFVFFVSWICFVVMRPHVYVLVFALLGPCRDFFDEGASLVN